MKNQINISKSCKGFTLIELMVTLVVASILLVMALPNFREMIRENQTTSEANKLIRDLNLARSESVQRGISVSVSRTGANWQSGWVVFTDLNADRAVSAGVDQILQVNDGLDANFTMPVTAGLNGGVTFSPDGSSNAGVAGSDFFRIVPPSGDARRINVNPTGRVTVTLL